MNFLSEPQTGPKNKVVRGPANGENSRILCRVEFTGDKLISDKFILHILKEISKMCISLVFHLFGTRAFSFVRGHRVRVNTVI